MEKSELDSLRELWPLTFWDKQEWYDVQRKLNWMDTNNITYQPARENIFNPLRVCSLSDCSVCIMGQDAYLQGATGIAFECEGRIPASLRRIFSELRRDLHGKYPSGGNLGAWCAQGVLLINATPTIGVEQDKDGKFKAYTHKYWPEWQALSREIVQKLSDKGNIVFAFLGSRARQYAEYVNEDNGVNTSLFYPHPSPMNRVSFDGCRMFSTINSKLEEYKKPVIDWSLS